MNLNLAAICDHAMVDQQGKLSLIGIFQNVWVAQFPAMHARLHLVLRLQGNRSEIGEHSIQIEFLDPDGEALIKGGGSVTFKDPPSGVSDIEASAILTFDLPLPKEGRYQFTIKIDDDLETVLPLTAMQQQIPQVSGDTSLN